MTDTITLPRSAVEQALKALEADNSKLWPSEKRAAAITFLRERLEQQQVEQEPVAEITGMDEYGPMLGWHKHWAEFPVGTKLYTRPQPKREPLTAEQIMTAWNEAEGTRYGFFPFARAIERAHGIVGE